MAVFFICKPEPLLPEFLLSAISSQLIGGGGARPLRPGSPFPPPTLKPILAARWPRVPPPGPSNGAALLPAGASRPRDPLLPAGPGRCRPGAAGPSPPRPVPRGSCLARRVPGPAVPGLVPGAGPRGGGAEAGRGPGAAVPVPVRAGLTLRRPHWLRRGGAVPPRQRREAAGTAGRRAALRCCSAATGTGGTGTGSGSGAGPGMHSARPDACPGQLGADRVSAAAGTGRGRGYPARAPPPRPGIAVMSGCCQ